MADTPDDATWLPEGAFVGLGVCQVEGCDRVGWALPTYGQAVIQFTVSEAIADSMGPIAPHVMDNVLLEVAWWCPEHGTGHETDIAKKRAMQVMDGVRQWAPDQKELLPDGAVRRRWEHQKDDVTLTVGNLDISMAVDGRRKLALQALRPLKPKP